MAFLQQTLHKARRHVLLVPRRIKEIRHNSKQLHSVAAKKEARYKTRNTCNEQQCAVRSPRSMAARSDQGRIMIRWSREPSSVLALSGNNLTKRIAFGALVTLTRAHQSGSTQVSLYPAFGQATWVWSLDRAA